ncbi:MAG: hypothetical protein ACRDRZ_11205 [Pseudonocardiaceae bacterium]
MNAPAAFRTTLVTSATDGRCHRVADNAYTPALVAGSGRYAALCGRRVQSAPMICPPGPDCRDCAAAAGGADTGAPPAGAGTGWCPVSYPATRLLARLTVRNGWHHDLVADDRGEPVAMVAVRVDKSSR